MRAAMPVGLMIVVLVANTVPRNARIMDKLDSVKVGDFIIVRHAQSNTDRAEKVERITKKLVITAKGRYNKDHGDEAGGGWYTNCARVPEDRAELDSVFTEMKRRALAYKLRAVEWRNFSLEVLNDVSDRIGLS